MNVFRIILTALLVMITSLVYAQSAKQKPVTIFEGLQKPSSFYVTQNEIFVVEQGQDRVLKLDLNGKLVESYGNKGSGDYQFNQPLDIDATNGLKVYISDTRNNRIQVFDKRWQLLSSINSYGVSNQNQRIEPTWLGVTKLGHLIFLDQRSGYLVKMDENGTFLDEIPVPKEIKEISKLKVIGNSIFILDDKSGVIHQLSDSGFYETFYPVDEVTSFYTLGSDMIFVSNDTLSMNQQDRIKVENAIDIVALESEIYILTVDSILKIELN